MQEKTIKSILHHKLDDWLSSITDNPSLVDLIRRDAMVTGGAITSLLTGAEPNDFDFYFKTKETTEAVARYYVKKFKLNPPSRFKSGAGKTVDIQVLSTDHRVKIVVKSQGIAGESGVDNYQYFEQPGVDPSEPQEFVENVVKDKEDAEKSSGKNGSKDSSKDGSTNKSKYRPVFLTSNAISLSDKIQIIIRFFGPIETIHENYDFVHCTCSWDAATGDLSLPHAALVSIINRRLKYKASKYPLCSIIRTRKFLKLGWHIDAGQYVKMGWDLHKLDLSNIEVLEDQMVGVDSAYFMEVIGMLRQRDEEVIKKGEDVKPIDASYLMEVIDKVFG